MSKFHPYIIPALDMLIGDPEVLTPEKGTKKKADYLCIPYQYVDRLDSFYHEYSSRGEAARFLIGTIGNMLEHLNETGSNCITCPNGMKVEFMDANVNSDSSTINAIYLAQRLLREKPQDTVAIMTGSDRMVAKAARAKISLAHINPETYTGRRKFKLPLDAADLWDGKRKMPKSECDQLFKQPLRANEFVEFSCPNFGQTLTGYSNIGRYDQHAEALVPLKRINFISPVYQTIRPLTPVQAMFMEALLSPVEEIPIIVVPGIFGIGKTFLPLAVGLNGVGYHTTKTNLNFDRIFVCPRDSALGKEIGFVKGDLTEKTLTKAMPILDNLREIVKMLDFSGPDEIAQAEISRLNQEIQHETDKRRRKNLKSQLNEAKAQAQYGSRLSDILDRYFEFQPIINMGGRSITDSLIIYDEFQDVERFQARELITRIGANSKMVFVGDPSQLSNPHLNRTSNGLNYVASKLADKHYAAVIAGNDEDEIVRHWVLREIARDFHSN